MAYTRRSDVKKVWAGVAVGVGVLALAACGSSSAGSAGSSASSQTSAAGTGQSALHAMLPAAIQQSNVVTLATNGESAPCESFASKDSTTLVGYEADLWNAMGTALGVKIQPTSLNFDGIIPGVQAGRFDMAMACISDNLKREDVVSFVDDAYATGAVFTLASDTSVTSEPLTMCGKKTAIVIGQDLGSTLKNILSPHCVKNGMAPISVSELPTLSAVLLDLYNGRIDFALGDYMQAQSLAAAAPKPIRYVTDPLLEKFYNGMVFGSKSTELQNAFLAALKYVQSTGEYDRILQKWNLSVQALTSPGINLSKTSPIAVPQP